MALGRGLELVVHVPSCGRQYTSSDLHSESIKSTRATPYSPVLGLVLVGEPGAGDGELVRLWPTGPQSRRKLTQSRQSAAGGRQLGSISAVTALFPVAVSPLFHAQNRPPRSPGPVSAPVPCPPLRLRPPVRRNLNRIPSRGPIRKGRKRGGGRRGC